MKHRRTPWTPYGIALATMVGLLIGVLLGDGGADQRPSRPVEKVKAPHVRMPETPEPAWLHTCVGLPTDTGCP